MNDLPTSTAAPSTAPVTAPSTAPVTAPSTVKATVTAKAAKAAPKGKAKAIAKAAVIEARRHSRLDGENGKPGVYVKVLDALRSGAKTVTILAKLSGAETERDVRHAIDRARNRSIKIVRTRKNEFGYEKGFKVPASF